jgi:bifunctional enzyme CysN/CysC
MPCKSCVQKVSCNDFLKPDYLSMVSSSLSAASPVRVITLGHVDHGKSTLLGRLLYDAHALSKEQLVALEKASMAEGKELEPAFLLDAFLEEQAENITIDTTSIPFATINGSFIMMDAPGHREFLKNMLTGVCAADAAIVLVSVIDGLQDQTRRHVQVLSLLGMQQVIVVINKLDRVAYSKQAFEQVAASMQELFNEFRLPQPKIIPAVALLGENVASPSAQMPWYKGPTLLQCLELLTAAPSFEQGPLRFVVQDIYRFYKDPLIVGRVESGSLTIGEELVFWPQAGEVRKSRLQSIEQWGSSPLKETKATAGQSIAITLSGCLAIQRGDVASSAVDLPIQSHDLFIRLFWLDSGSLAVGHEMILQLGTQRLLARVSSIEHVVDATTMNVNTECALSLKQHEVGDVKFYLEHPLVYDSYHKLPLMGRVVMRRAHTALSRLAGAGIILATNKAVMIL